MNVRPESPPQIGAIPLLLFSFCLASITSMAGPGPLTAEGGDDSPVATYRQKVSAAELDTFLAFRQSNRGGPPGRQSSTIDRDQALREMILMRGLAAEALRLGLDQEPDLRLQLEAKEASRARRLLRRQLEDSLEFTEAEVEAKYQAIKDTYTRPRRLRLRNLFLRYPPEADAAAQASVRERLLALRQRALAGEDFAALAKAHSQSQTRLQGGLLGNVRPGKFHPEVDRVAMALAEGEVSDILESPEGLTILYCEQILPKVVRSPEEMRRISRDLLVNHAFRQGWFDYEKELTAKAAPEIDWDLWEGVGGAEEAAVVFYRGGILSLGLLRAALGARGRDVPREKVLARVKGLVLDRILVREAAGRGLLKEGAVNGRKASEAQWQRWQILSVATLTHQIDQRLVRPTEEEIRVAHESIGEELQRPEHYRVGAIAIPLDDDPRPAYALGARLLHQIRGGGLAFDEAAKQHSVHPSAAQGGDLGWVSRWSLPSRLGVDGLRAFLALGEGEISELTQSEGQVWILRHLGYQDKRPMTFAEARETVENRLGGQRVERLEAEITAEWLQRLDIQVESRAATGLAAVKESADREGKRP